jgi:hypothetical protein
MNRNLRFRLILASLALFGAASLTVSAQTANPATDKDASPTAEPKKRARPVSNEVAAALAAVMPKYDPPKPVEPKPEEELEDLRETDKPRNKIIRLPEHVVREKKPPVFNERELRNKDNYAKQQYAGLNLSPFNESIARQLLWEDDRLKSKADFADLARTGSIDDPETKRYYKKVMNETYVLPTDTVYRTSDAPQGVDTSMLRFGQ